MMKRTAVGLIVAFVLLASALGTRETPPSFAEVPGSAATPLLQCPDVGGDGVVDLFADIFEVAFRFGLGPGDPGYQFLYNVSPPVNSPIDLFEDVFGVALRFGENCPLADVQVAQATLGILNDPQAADLLSCNESVLNARGYFRAGGDVPGQGVHYLNTSYWDGVFNVTQPEGLVCQGGQLAAELYVVNGYVVGWGPFTPGGGSPIHSINIVTFCTPPSGQTACSWAGSETWHAHSNLCLLHMGTPSSTIVLAASAAACEAMNGGVGTWVWAAGVGWMGHLWNFMPNENLTDVDGEMNGRFVDCRPPFKGETCPM